MSQFRLGFKTLHHDKLIDGKDAFSPCRCVAFLYSKINTPEYIVPLIIDLPASLPTPISPPKVILRKYAGQDEAGFYTYIVDIAKTKVALAGFYKGSEK